MLINNHFIVLEGLDGSGKTTVIREIIKPLFNTNTIYTKEPGGTGISDSIRDIILNPYTEEYLHPLAELLLFYSARIQNITNIINPSLLKGNNVVCDRFTWSTIAYQHGGLGIDINIIKQMENIVISTDKKPIIIYLDISPETAMYRIKMSAKTSKYDTEKKEFFTRVRQQYLKLVSSDDLCYIIDAEQSLTQVKQEVTKIINAL